MYQQRTKSANRALAENRKRITRTHPKARKTVLKDYLTLTKPEISLVVMLSAMAGFILGSPEELSFTLLLSTLLGVVLSSGGVGALNQYMERAFDARMRRTASRPLPADRLSPMSAMVFGIGLVLAGLGVLFLLVNALTAILGALTAILYLFVYTPFKRVTKYNTLIGTVPGALPALGGWTAATGSLSLGGWLIFGILAAWQMPHFLTLAWIYREDYRRGGYAMLPVVEPDGRSTAQQTLFFTATLFVIALAPVVIGIAGWVYLTGMTMLGLWFLWEAIRYYRSRSTADAGRVFKVSIYYVPLFVALIVIDWFV